MSADTRDRSKEYREAKGANVTETTGIIWARKDSTLKLETASSEPGRSVLNPRLEPDVVGVGA